MSQGTRSAERPRFWCTPDGVYAVTFRQLFVVLDYASCGGEISCFDLEGEREWHNGMKGRGGGSVALALPDNARQADLSDA